LSSSTKAIKAGLRYVGCILPASLVEQLSRLEDSDLGPDQGIVQLAVHDRPAGEKIDLYAAVRRISEALVLGILDLDAGENEIVLRLVGRNPRSSGLGLDLAEIVLEPLR